MKGSLEGIWPNPRFSRWGFLRHREGERCAQQHTAIRKGRWKQVSEVSSQCSPPRPHWPLVLAGRQDTVFPSFLSSVLTAGLTSSLTDFSWKSGANRVVGQSYFLKPWLAFSGLLPDCALLGWKQIASDPLWKVPSHSLVFCSLSGSWPDFLRSSSCWYTDGFQRLDASYSPSETWCEFFVSVLAASEIKAV